MKKVAPVGQNRDVDEASNSDSGDSIFITQKTIPEAIRPRGENRPHLSPFCTQEELADHEDEAASSSSDVESKTNRKQKKRVLGVPTFNFSFLSKGKRQTDLTRDKIKKLHSYVIGGFFKSSQELWKSYERGEDMTESLPTVDVDGECMSPIPEEETMEDEDIKVVERKHFATSIKARSSQPWCTPKTRSSEKGKPSQEQKGSQGERRKAARQVSKCKTDKVAPSSATQTPHREDALCRDLTETEPLVTRDENTRTETETGKRVKGKTKQLGNGSIKKLNPKRDTQRDRDPHTDVLHEDGQSSSGNAECSHERQKLPQSDINNDTPCLKKRKKKGGRGGCESVEKGAEQSQAETEGKPEEHLPSLLEDINVTTVPHSEPEKKKPATAGRQDQSAQSMEEPSGVISQADWKKKKDVDVESRDANETAEPPANQVNVQKKRDLNEPSDLSQTPTERPGEVGADSEDTEAPQETLGSSFTKRKKKKKKELPDSSDKDVNFCNGAVTNADLTVKKKKKMVDVSHTAEEDESVDNTQTEERETERRTKKKKRKQSWYCEDTTALAENSVFVRKKIKGPSFLPADEEENGAEAERSRLQSKAEKPDVSANGLAATSEEFPESSAESKNRVKKKKQRSAEQDCVKGETEWEEPKETAEPEVKKKKRKRKDSEMMSPTEKYVDELQAEEDVPLKKKKKKKIPPAATEDAESELTLDSPKKLKNKKAADKLSLLNKKPFPKTADSEAHKSQQPGRTEPDFNFSSASETSRMKQKKNKKKRLHHPNQDFLFDL
ncbi:hepatoma-derived growth factor-related protein 2 [Nematolebias whitei]|uniref:hepatoma-derived growth factor-related protein 2 n=1 Tax=Nematolebias whitei TaxID=451745 RepID=UPI0018996B72|nr:hepatoma-derived growth factor-related protein 2 [Nematolebias whitei]